MWAIGAKWLHMAKLKDEDPRNDDHLVYYALARALRLAHRIIKDHPNVRGIQVLGPAILSKGRLLDKSVL
jgi:hypothetical protein